MLPVLCAKYSIFFYILSTGVIRAALFESLILHHKKNKPEDYCNIPPASTVDIPSRWDPQGRAVQVLLSAQKKKRHTNVCSPVDIPTGWEPRTEQQPTGLIAHPAAQGRAVQVLLSAPRKDIRMYVFSWCSKAIQIRTISLGCNFCRFSKGDGLCAFFIVEGYQNLIIIQVNRIDEGIHQCLPLVFQAHIQLTEPQQPEPDKLLCDLGLRQLFFCKTKNPNPSPIGKKFGFSLFGADKRT